MKHKEMQKYIMQQAMLSKAKKQAEEYASGTITGVIFNSIFVLADKFGFRKPRIKKFLREMMLATLSYEHEAKTGNAITFEELNNVLIEEYKIDLFGEIKEIEKEFKEIKGIK